MVWPMVEVEADDALAAAAATAAADKRVRQVLLCSPDKDLALVGDSADGFPGLPGWGAKSAATVLARYGHLEKIPADSAQWDVSLRGAEKLARVLREGWKDAILFRKLATLRPDQPKVTVDQLAYRGPEPRFEALAASWHRPKLFERARAIAGK